MLAAMSTPRRHGLHGGKAGLAPGTLIYTGPAKDFSAQAELIAYEGERFGREPLSGPFVSRPHIKAGVNWLRVVGLHEVALVRGLADAVGLHPFLQEDVLYTNQRPKLEEDEDTVFIAAKGVAYDEQRRVVTVSHQAIAWRRDFVVTFQENEAGDFDHVLARVERGLGRVRRGGPDYLVAALLDSVVDGYLLTLDALASEVAGLEEDILEGLTEPLIHDIYACRRRILLVRELLSPMRALVRRLAHNEKSFANENARLLIRDVSVHTAQAGETLDTLDELTAGLLDVSFNLAGLRMNQVMKTLTVVTAVFIPLTFIAGVYGMNFKHMPELGWRWGYYSVLGGMVAIACGLVVFFRSRKWF